ncbi:MAG TPA: LemA family protein [Candidatus Sulfotelmatobacter sp.]|jgi:LemA protein|nr:LemA family protein [Candidatus Sulfotelmatobacter sp.]
MKYFTPLLVIASIVILCLFWVGGIYNTLVSERIAVQTAESQVEAQLQRRFDLIPNLVASVKGAQIQEQKVFKDIADARTHYAGTTPSSSDRIAAANQYESAISRLLVIVESYPQLTSNQSIKDLMTELEGTENRISVARQRYNETDQQYMQQLQIFPGNLVAGIFHFQSLPLFQSTPGAQVAPSVNFTK